MSESRARQPVILSAVRTAVGKFGRSLRDVSAPRLGSLVIREAVRRAQVRARDVQEVIMGNVVSAGIGQNPARQAARGAGLPDAIGSLTVNKVCGSGLKAVMLAAQAIKAGDYDLMVAGGMESMSNAPYLVRAARWGAKFGDSRMVDAMIHDGLWDAYNDFHMGVTGEIVARRHRITRPEADQFALRSHRLAAKATQSGVFRQEIIPVQVNGPNGTPAQFAADEGIRFDTSLEKLAALPPVFKKNGVLTAGNSSQLSDGAAALVVASRTRAERLGLAPLARIVDYETGGTKPELVMETPIPTCRRLLKRARFTIADLDLVEHNEAYATASLAVMRALDIPERKFNIRGGAVAMGHPIGCSGARLLVTLLHALQDEKLHRGLVTLCLGGGNAVSTIIDREE